MADDPNMNFEAFTQSLCNQHVVSFQTSATSSGSGGMPTYLDCSTGMDASVGMLSTTPSVVVSTGSSNMPADQVPSLKYGGPLASDWTPLELQILKDGLERYVHEQGIMKYIKIAASLQNKTVRDVAMRCQWVGMHNANAQEGAAGSCLLSMNTEFMQLEQNVDKQSPPWKKVNTRRRKSQEQQTGRNIKERKVVSQDKFAEPAPWGANHPLQTGMGASSFIQNNVQNNLLLSGGCASEIDPVQLLLEENNRLLNQIETNILTLQVHSNFDLFQQARSNINDLLQITAQLPGMRTKMPPLRVSVNENLASFILPGITVDQVLASSHLKEEPWGW